MGIAHRTLAGHARPTGLLFCNLQFKIFNFFFPFLSYRAFLYDPGLDSTGSGY